MIDGIQAAAGMQNPAVMRALLASQAASGTGAAGRQKVKEEFLAIFYKELLKQTFQAPKLSIGDEDGEGNPMTAAFGTDMLVDKLAAELAKSGAFSVSNFFPADIEGK